MSQGKIDTLKAAQAPLIRLLHDVPFSDWANICIVCDSGATEALRWSGGIPFLLQELGIYQVYDLHSFNGSSSSNVLSSERVIFLVTGFLWDLESLIINAVRRLKATEIFIGSAISEAAHSCHEQSNILSQHPEGNISFSVFSENLQLSLDRLHRFSTQGKLNSPPVHLDFKQTLHRLSDDHQTLSSDTTVSVTVKHLPLHIGVVSQNFFGLCGHSASKVFPFKHWSSSANNTMNLSLNFQLKAEMVMPRVRLSWRHLSHSLVDVIYEQLHLNVDGHIFSLGPTSNLIGTTLATLLSERQAEEGLLGTRGGTRFSSNLPNERRLSSLVLIDRTLDMASSVRLGKNLLGRVFCTVPRSGSDDHCTSISQANLHDVSFHNKSQPIIGSESCSACFQLAPFPAVASFPWKGSYSICHTGDSNMSELMWDLASLPEDRAHKVLCDRLSGVLEGAGYSLPPKKKRGMGAEIFALLQEFIPKKTGISKKDMLNLCNKNYRLVQIALAVVESLQRTAKSSDPVRIPGWDEISSAQNALQQSLQDGAQFENLLVQVAELLHSLAKKGNGSYRQLEYEGKLLVLFAAALGTCHMSHADEEQVALYGEGLAMMSARNKLESALFEIALLKGTDPERAKLLASKQATLLIEIPKLSRIILKTAEMRTCTPYSIQFGLSESNQNDDDGWNDWENSDIQPLFVECQTLFGKLAARLLLKNDIQELVHAKTVNIATAGLGLLSAGLRTLRRGGLQTPQISAPKPYHREIIVLFVVGGFTMEEVQEVRSVQEAAGADSPQLILGGTTLTTPGFIYDQVFDEVDK